jgi:hypothetical protein
MGNQKLGFTEKAAWSRRKHGKLKKSCVVEAAGVEFPIGSAFTHCILIENV